MINLFNLKYRTKRKNRIKQSVSWNITNWIMFAFYLAFALFYIWLLVWLFFTGLKTQREISFNPFSWPSELRFYHYKDMIKLFSYKKHTFWEMIWNSTWISVGGSLIMMLTCASTSYIAAKYTFPGSKYIAIFIMFTLIFPLYGSTGATYRLMFKFGLHDSPLYLLWYCGFGGWSWFYFQSFWINLSWTYAEAAQIDGANDWIIFYKVMLPQAFGMFGALFITTWITQWQDYSNALLYLKEVPTLSLGIYYFESTMKSQQRLDILFCACFVSLLPVFLIYIVFNGFLFKNISVGGIKM